MSVDKDTVRRIARLARLKIEEERVEPMMQELNGILAWVEQLKEVDVEGVAPANIGYVVYGKTLIAPCTALAVIEMIKSTGVPIRGAEAVVVGASEIAGKPISLEFFTVNS